MAFRSGARVLETTTTTGTGAITLAGAVSGYRTFASVATADGDTFYYVIAGGTEWEEGYGTRTSATTFARTTPLASSSGTLPFNFTVSSKEVWMDIPGRVAQGRGLYSGELYGLGLTNGTDTTNDINIAVGHAADSTNIDLMRLETALGKQTDVNWAVGGTTGTPAGGLDTGVVGNNTYHVFLIKRPDTGVVDALFSLSATAPTLPANYTLFRRIGSITRTAGSIRQFYQTGDTFWLAASVTIKTTLVDVAYGLFTLTGCPTGIKVQPIIENQAGGNNSTYNAYCSDPADTGNTNFFVLADMNSGVDANRDSHSFILPFYTNTSAQIRAAFVNVTTLDFITISFSGWIDDRGKRGIP